MIAAQDLSITVGARVLLEPVSFRIERGQKIGLVGLNGAGKSTLVSVLSRDPAPGVEVTGSVETPMQLGLIQQTPPRAGSGRFPTIRSHLLAARGLDALEAAMEDALHTMSDDPSEEHVSAYSAAEETYRHSDGYEAEARIKKLMAGVGLGDIPVESELAALSGGQRRRVELVRALFAPTDALILDEPTNHLDKSSKVWLMDELAQYDGALLIVSHDLALLDRAITRIFHLEHGRLTQYKGNYTQYQTVRAQDENRMEKTARLQQREMHRLSQLAEVMRHQSAKRARTAHAIDARVERMKQQGPEAPVRKRTPPVYHLPDPPQSGIEVLALDDVWKGYGDLIVISELSLRLARGERLVIIGVNGAGKSTLVRLITGADVPDVGEVRLDRMARVGWYAQEQENLRMEIPAYENVGGSALSVQERRRLMGAFGITGDTGVQRTSTLSGGERTKLSFAQLTSGEFNLLVLDEPTNNLDPASRDAAGGAFGKWKGTLIVVSHDREFVKAIHPTHALILPEGTMAYWKDDFLDLVEERHTVKRGKGQKG